MPLYTFFNIRLLLSKDKPNIILIVADDLGYGDTGPFGQKLIHTPNIDRMAAEGLVLYRHYAGTSVSAPSRCALMTGFHTGHCEVRGNLQAQPFGQMPLSDAALTLAEAMKKAGYSTAMIGKWGLGEPGTTGDPNRQGFDLFYGYTDQVLAHNHFPEYLIRNGMKESLNNRVTWLDSLQWHKGRGSISSQRNDFADELFAREALKFITDNKNNSFFLYLPFIIPHDNGEAPFDERFEVPSQREYANMDWNKREKDYAASVSFLDDYIGSIREHLRMTGLDKKTLIIFTSDNGPENDDSRFDSNGGLRGIKRDLYEGGIRVPFVACWPGTVKPDVNQTAVTAFWDYLPTLAELAGMQSSAFHTDGISFLPLLMGKKGKQHEFLYFEFHEKGGAQAVIKGKWKAIWLDVKTAIPSSVELYNLEDDPAESIDLAIQYPEVIAVMERIRINARTESKIFTLDY
jgi:arylsulfatase A-like enzyme